MRQGETEVPEGLKKALAAGNRWQDLLTDSFAVGRTGNEIFARTDAGAKKEGLNHSTYSHPVGFHGHAAGPAMGMWDNQQGNVPVTGAVADGGGDGVCDRGQREGGGARVEGTVRADQAGADGVASTAHASHTRRDVRPSGTSSARASGA